MSFPNHLFVGRALELRRIVERLGADRPQSVSLVGDYRMGKSALLRALCSAPASGSRAYPSGTVIMMLALREEGTADPASFFAMFQRTYVQQTGNCIPERSSHSFQALQDVAQCIHEGGGRLLLLLDDFDIVTEQPTFGAEFFASLRALASNLSVAYVTSSRADLQQLCVLREVEQSPFFNIFQNMLLRPLPAAESREMVLAHLRAGGLLADEDAVSSVMWVAGGLPALVEPAVLALDRHTGRNIDPEQHLADTLHKADGYLRELWARFTEAEQDVLKCVVTGGDLDRRTARTVRELSVRRGYLVQAEGEGAYAFSSAALERFVRQQEGPAWRQRARKFFRRKLLGRRS